MFIATLIAADRLSGGDISVAEDTLAGIGAETLGRAWIEDGKACDVRLGRAPPPRALEGVAPAVDVVVQPEAQRRRRLLVADMDSTMITVECIDELADYAGVKAEIAAITERAMRGELEFEQALEERVALLAGLEEATLDRCHAERVRITPGARALVRTMNRDGALCVLVSGGFSRFADRVAAEIGFDRAVSNGLEIADGRLTGRVAPPILGADAKRRALLDAAEQSGVPLDAALAVGDGANDVPMIRAAGLGVAYRGKPALAEAADARIEHNDLTALLYAQGYGRSEWEPD